MLSSETASKEPRTHQPDTALEALAQELVAKLQIDPARISDEAMRGLFSTLIQAYGAKFDEGRRPLPIDPDFPPTATNVLVTVSALMKASNLEIFELGMWQSWSGTR